ASEVVRERVSSLSIDALQERAAAANAELYNLGITFTIYSDAQTIDRILPFDVLPRILSAAEWSHIERGVVQRITALNLLPDDIGLRPIDNYGAKLIAALQEVAPARASDPRVVLLSPGTYNSAYFEHVFLAREMGVPLVEGPDLAVEDDRVFMRTTGGPAPVD